jgi:hypothetical protein
MKEIRYRGKKWYGFPGRRRRQSSQFMFALHQWLSYREWRISPWHVEDGKRVYESLICFKTKADAAEFKVRFY